MVSTGLLSIIPYFGFFVSSLIVLSHTKLGQDANWCLAGVLCLLRFWFTLKHFWRFMLVAIWFGLFGLLYIWILIRSSLCTKPIPFVLTLMGIFFSQ
ncbi:hypothetical protein L211DRAFT_719930 [Terfezia boudieri ATCC MYA-4762]|uniref:Uncharacterized protein n=1 Tax=Terfezia boudieri ATCC MYA-4762 TaxID=1051890 RepID=A0A3N4L6S4_9PEZI|nr:hypothetical protein L211DRAFT_719930 [Terfezia boudieri ATCC MYA-4762]